MPALTLITVKKVSSDCPTIPFAILVDACYFHWITIDYNEHMQLNIREYSTCVCITSIYQH